MQVNIFEIERFAIHDGPGIRTTVFFQGCPLRCPWCANPESQTTGTLLMHYASRCVGCGQCVGACPEHRITIAGGKPHFQTHQCVDCHICEDQCLQNAIKIVGRKATVDEIMLTVMRDKDYYDHSGGGVTLSGGEALMQREAAMELLTRCKAEGIHTAVETCGQVGLATIEQVMPMVDLFLFDVKQTDAEVLRSVTHGAWEQIQRNIAYIAQSDPEKIVLRVPCIPGFNMTGNFFESLFAFAQRHGVRRIDLLPYHTLGVDKYAQLGRSYSLHCSPLCKDDLVAYQHQGQGMGLNVRIG